MLRRRQNAGIKQPTAAPARARSTKKELKKALEMDPAFEIVLGELASSVVALQPEARCRLHTECASTQVDTTAGETEPLATASLPVVIANIARLTGNTSKIVRTSLDTSAQTLADRQGVEQRDPTSGRPEVIKATPDMKKDVARAMLGVLISVIATNKSPVLFNGSHFGVYDLRSPIAVQEKMAHEELGVTMAMPVTESAVIGATLAAMTTASASPLGCNAGGMQAGRGDRNMGGGEKMLEKIKKNANEEEMLAVPGLEQGPNDRSPGAYARARSEQFAPRQEETPMGLPSKASAQVALSARTLEPPPFTQGNVPPVPSYKRKLGTESGQSGLWPAVA